MLTASFCKDACSLKKVWTIIIVFVDYCAPCIIVLYSCVDFDLDSVLYELQRLKFPAHKWRLLANSLRVGSVVDNIDADHRDVASKLQALVSHWVKNTTQHNQWITLVEAIVMCDECDVAEQLATVTAVEYTPSSHSGMLYVTIHE